MRNRGEKGKMPVFALWLGVLGVASSSRCDTCSFLFVLESSFGSSLVGERGGVISVELEYWESPANRDDEEEDPEEAESVRESAGKTRKGEAKDIERRGNKIKPKVEE